MQEPEGLDTTKAPPAEEAPAGQEVVAEEAGQGTVAEEQPTGEPQEPETMDAQQLRSWVGRRDAQLRQEFQQQMGQLQQGIQALATAAYQKTQPATPAEPPDPAQDANAWFDHKLQAHNKQIQDFHNTVGATTAGYIRNDPLVQANPNLGTEIYQEIMSGRIPVKQGVKATDAAEALYISAKANVLQRLMTTRPNPLKGNKGANVPLGTETAPPAKPTKKVELDADPETIRIAKSWGYTEDRINELFGKK